MAAGYESADSVEAMASSIIGTHHPELASANITYLFMDKTPSKGGRDVPGKATKVSGRWSYLTGQNFVIEVASPMWSEFSEDQRLALVDHLLECCTGEEEEDTGEMKWSIRSPDVQEFATILDRHGIWNPDLLSFVRVAQEVDLSGILEEELGESESESGTVGATTAEAEVDLNDVEDIDALLDNDDD